MTWTLRMATTYYTVAVEPGGRWAELVAWGPHGVECGPSPLKNLGEIHFITEADAAPVERDGIEDPRLDILRVIALDRLHRARVGERPLAMRHRVCTLVQLGHRRDVGTLTRRRITGG